MKHILPIFVFAAMLLTACNQNAPTTYDKVAGHTYASQDGAGHQVDTIIFYNDGSLKSIWPNANYKQIDQMVIIDTRNGILYFESSNKRIINWEKRYYYDRID